VIIDYFGGEPGGGGRANLTGRRSDNAYLRVEKSRTNCVLVDTRGNDLEIDKVDSGRPLDTGGIPRTGGGALKYGCPE